MVQCGLAQDQNIPAVMANTFLDSVIQPRYLTSMGSDVSINSIMSSFGSNMMGALQSWGMYILGYGVCVVIGILLSLVMTLGCLIVPCCRCCGNCGGGDPEKSKSKKRSRGCCCCCYGTLVIISIGLLLGATAIYIMGNQLYDQLSGSQITPDNSKNTSSSGHTIFDTVADGVDGISQYLNGIAPDMEKAVLPPFVAMTQQIFDNLYALPGNAVDVLNNATGMLQTLTGIQSFTNKLPALQTNLMQADFLAKNLNTSAGALDATIGPDLVANFSAILASLSTCTQPLCVSVKAMVNQTAHVRVDYSAVNLTFAIYATNYSIQTGLGQEVNNSIDQVNKISSKVTSSTGSKIGDAKSKANDTQNTIKDFISSITSSLDGLDIGSYKSQITDLKKMLPSTAMLGVKWGIVGLASVIIFITFFYVLGLLGGVCLPQRKLAHDRCCDKTCASRCLTAGMSLTFIFFWLFTFLTTILFTIGGITHTEFCRHVVNVDKTPPDSQSMQVLFLFDSWISGMIPTPGFDVQPFHMYNSCIYDDSIYRTLHLEKTNNLTAKINTDGINSALTDIKNLNITVPQINLTNPVLTGILLTLDQAFGPQGLNFTYMNQHVSGSITEPDLVILANDLNTLSVSLSDSSLTQYSVGLNAYYQQQVDPIKTQSNQLNQDLSTSQSITGTTSFGKAADNLNTSQQVINSNGTKIVDAYISSDVDYINNLILTYVGNTIDAVENKVGRCRPLHDSLAKILDALCVDLLYPINGFWFSLGWCIFFLQVGIFFAVQLGTMLKYASSQNQVTHQDDVKEAI